MCLEPRHSHTAASFLIATTIVRGGSCHQRATAVFKTGQPNIYCRDAHFCSDREEEEEVCAESGPQVRGESRVLCDWEWEGLKKNEEEETERERVEVFGLSHQLCRLRRLRVGLKSLLRLFA